MEINYILVCYFIEAAILFTVLFFVPGWLFINRFFPRILGKLPLSFGVGICLWTFQSYFAHLLNWLWLSWAYLLIFIVIFLKTRAYRSFKSDPIKIEWIICLIVVLGCIIQLMAVIPSGLKASQGIWFYYINAYDGIYYLDLTQNLTKSFPPAEPGFSSHIVKNYYYLAELTIADVSRMFHLPSLFLLFQAFPLLISIIRGVIAYYLGLFFTKSKWGGRVFAFLVYFGSDVGFIFSVILLHSFSINNLQAIDSSNLLLTNLPRGFAEVVFLSGLLLLLESMKNFQIKQLLICGLIFALSLGFKIYYGIFGGLLWGFVAIIFLLTHRKYRQLIWLLPVPLLAGLIYFPVNYGAGGLFWSPFSWPRHYFASTALKDTLWPLKEQVYIEHRNYPHLLFLNLEEAIIFLLATLGTRAFGLLPQIKKKYSMPNRYLYTLIYVLSTSFLLITVFFLQRSGLYNTFNFLSVAALLLSLLTAYNLSQLHSSHNKTFLIVSICLLVLTLPRPLLDFTEQIQSPIAKDSHAYLISNQELSALSYLRQNSPQESLILVDPANGQDYDSPYVEYFSARPTFLSNLGILQSHNQSTLEREVIVRNITNSADKFILLSQLKQQHINFIYLKFPLNKQFDYAYNSDEIFYQNTEVLIVKVE